MKLRKTISFFVLFLITSNNINAQWQKTHGPYGGNIMALAVKDSAVFAGTDGGGIYKTTDNGANWVASTSNLASFAAYSFAVTDSSIYAGGMTQVLLYSDSSNYWAQVNNSSLGNKIYSLVVKDSIMFAGTLFGGLIKSPDKGMNWYLTSITNPPLALAVFNSNIFAGTYGDGIFISSDNGASWDTINKGLPMPIDINAFSVTGTDIFAGTDNGIYKFNFIDSSWTAIGLTNYSVRSLAISGANIYAGTSDAGLFYSSNSGISWSSSINDGLLFKRINAIVIKDSNIFAGTESGGVFLSQNNGMSWIAVNNGITDASCALVFVEDTDIYTNNVGSSMSGGIFKSINNGLDWSFTNFNYNELISLLAKDDSIIFALTFAERNIIRSIDNGISWTNINNSLATTDFYEFIKHGAYIYTSYSGEGIFLSTDNGNNWIAANNGLPLTGDMTFGRLTIIDTNIFASNSNYNIYVSSIYNPNWHLISNLGAFGQTTTLNGKLIVLTLNNGIYSIYYSGTNWVTEQISTLNVGCMAVSGTNIFTLTTDSTVYLSTDTCNSWTNVSDGLDPSLMIISLSVNGNYIFASTLNKGIWRRPLSDMVGINELQHTKPEAIRVFPNPATSQTTIAYPQIKEEGDIEVYNMLGQMVYEEKIAKGSSQSELNIKNYKTGLYKVILREKGIIKGEVSLVKN